MENEGHKVQSHSEAAKRAELGCWEETCRLQINRSEKPRVSGRAATEGARPGWNTGAEKRLHPSERETGAAGNALRGLGNNTGLKGGCQRE